MIIASRVRHTNSDIDPKPNQSHPVEVYVKKGILLLASVALLFTTIAQAHGPTRQKMVVTQEISAPPETIWDLVKNFDDMSWHPAVT
jgi:hypothetical protein